MARATIPWARILAEFVAIFAGVTLSLLADEWREDRQDRAREHEVLQDIVADLKRDSIELAVMSARMVEWDEAAVWVNTHADLPRVREDSAMAHLKVIGQIPFYQPVSSAYSGLRDAGLLYLIEDSQLRNRIVNYFEVQQPFMNQFFAVTHAGWRRWYIITAGHIDWVVPPGSNSIWATLENGELQSWQAFVEDPVVMNHVDWAGLIGANTALRIGQVQRVNVDLRSTVASYLETN